MGAKDQGATATDGRWIVIPRTLVFVTHGNDVLLLKRGAHKRIFPNRYNGLGGHLERDEDPLRGVIREIEEESGLQVTNTRLRGVINIDAGEHSGILLFVFSAEALSRAFTDTEEGTLEWIPLQDAPYKDLVEDVPLLLDRLFGAKASDALFFGHESYDDQDRMILRFAD